MNRALPPVTTPNHTELIDVDCLSIMGDIRDKGKLADVIQREAPDIIFHLAAQSLGHKSYEDPVETFATNVMGTVNLLEACRKVEDEKAIIIITSDKCYENRECNKGYDENDALGGHDPYSASKGCAEIVTSS